MKKFGIDISRWQGEFNLTKAKKEGVEFVVIKGGGADDGLYVDRMFERNYKEAKAKDLPVGCYWFSKALTTSDAKKEAEYLHKNILSGKEFELPIYMDVEHKAMMALGKDKLTDIVIAFCETLEKLGYFVGIYSSKMYFEAKMHDDKLQSYAHWVAQWSKECTYKGEENVLGMWQFGGETNVLRSNKVADVVCDQNYMYLDYPTLIKAMGLNGYKKESTPSEEPAKEPQKEEPFFVAEGELVSLSENATDLNTKKKFADWVYKTNLYVRKVDFRRIVVSTSMEGDITGAVDILNVKRPI